jgi:hypothetical protein
MSVITKILIVFFILFLSGITQAQYAPWAKLSKDAPKEINARKYPVPTKDEVGIPPYPGAVISSVSAPREDTLKFKKEILPFVILVSKDSPDRVISYYKKKLTKAAGWNYNEEFKTFVKGPPGSALTGFVPAVAIRDESGENFDLVHVDENLKRNLKSRIEITYNPAKKKE